MNGVEDRKSWRKMGGVGENAHELEKNAKMLEKIITIIVSSSASAAATTLQDFSTAKLKIFPILPKLFSMLPEPH